ncbi:ubiquitin carboxyl-terminal hydrolase, family 1 [Lojkania enalia]|uniref:Ubiquitin carboxyl-terminal hydrolase n=1 Tax=Lojkania enalia TaxID=147567 RepID=A0A9P4KBB8_9PLEO|nr:ubiquitin carboxyl-terminal hydrolase, family 1 [Didymosphaeria enalia]
MALPAQVYRKHFIPLESNPEIFTELIRKLGVSESLEFQDVYSLDEPQLLALIPRPVHALILVFPTTERYEKRIASEEAEAEDYNTSGADEDVVFFKQTIDNACGLYAILHAVSNGDARKYIEGGSSLSRLIDTCVTLKPSERALALEDSRELESSYESVASQGDTDAPDDPEDEVDFHYICFVKSHKNGHLFQLDGDRKRPIDLGPAGIGDDVLSESVVGVIRSMIESEGGENINFSLMALVNAQD